MKVDKLLAEAFGPFHFHRWHPARAVCTVCGATQLDVAEHAPTSPQGMAILTRCVVLQGVKFCRRQRIRARRRVRVRLWTRSPLRLTRKQARARRRRR